MPGIKNDIELKRLTVKLEDETTEGENGKTMVIAAGTTTSIVFKDPLIIESEEEGIEILCILQDAFQEIFEDEVILNTKYKDNLNCEFMQNVDLSNESV